jgi:hypothetical protein
MFRDTNILLQETISFRWLVSLFEWGAEAVSGTQLPRGLAELTEFTRLTHLGYDMLR